MLPSKFLSSTVLSALSFARIDARRPPAWIAAIAATVVATLLPLDVPPGLPGSSVAAVVLGGLLAVAAIGAPPRTGSAALDAGWAVARSAWPAVGWAAALLLRGAPQIAAWGCLGAALAGGGLAAVARLRFVPADAAGFVLVAVGVSGALGWWGTAAWEAGRVGAAVAAATMAAGIAAAWAVSTADRGSGTMRHLASHLLTGAAMAGTLTGMVMWLFLFPELARLDLVASLAWFVALAVPAATLGDGVSHATVWRRCERAAPLAPGWPPRVGPGRRRDTLRAPLLAAAILGWPPFVAAAVAGFGGGHAAWSTAIIAGLAVGVLLVFATTALGEAAGLSPDAQQSAALAAVGLAAVVLLRAAAVAIPAPPASLVGGGSRGPNDVEQTDGSCHTSNVAQPHAGLPARFRKGSRSGATAHDMEWTASIPTA